MSDDLNYRVKLWQPPTRPEWLQRMNAEGACLDLKSVVPLDENSLLAHARANTGLSDFGSDDWYEPFKVLIKSIDDEAELNLMGRLMTRSDLLMHLEARLRVEEAYKQHPEIEEQQVIAPLLITGAGRCGTSAIQNLLAEDPDSGTLTHWEALFPAPPPEKASYRSDPRIAIADARMTQWNRVTPEIESMHEFGGEMPTELIQIEALSFQSVSWLGLYGFAPTYAAYMAQRENIPALKYALRVLKLLQFKNPRQRWVLKSPYAMNYLPEVFKVFPDARLIWMHRDPLKACSSVVSLVGTLLWIRSDMPLSEAAFTQLTNPAAAAGQFNRVIDQIEQGQIPESQVFNVQYLDFIENPVAAVEQLYQRLGLQLTTAARNRMNEYLASNPRENRPAHRYATGDSARYAHERELFERYQTRFQVSNEISTTPSF